MDYDDLEECIEERKKLIEERDRLIEERDQLRAEISNMEQDSWEKYDRED